MTTITLTQKTEKKFSSKQLETFVNSDKFEDIVLGYQMLEWATWKTQSYTSFKHGLSV